MGEKETELVLLRVCVCFFHVIVCQKMVSIFVLFQRNLSITRKSIHAVVRFGELIFIVLNSELSSVAALNGCNAVHMHNG